MTPPLSRGFVEVADRVFVARYPQWDVGVGLVLGRDGAVVVDTRASDREGREVLEDVDRLGRDVEIRHVVNTHVHFDHTFGNVAFESATVHAHGNVARTLDTHAEHIRAALRADPRGAPEFGYTEADALPVLEEGRASRRGGDRSRVAAVAGRPAQREPADTRPQAPLTVLPGPSPLRGYRGTAVP